MIRMSRFLSGALLALALLAPAAPADAAQINMCRAAAAGATAGPGRWTAPSSNTSYTLNNSGCTLIAPADLGDAQAAGFTLRSQIFSVVANKLLAAGTVTLPAGTYIDRIIYQETSAAAVTGGIKIGTTSGGTQVVSAAICAASCLVWLNDASISTRIFATTAPQVLYIDAVTNWSSGPQLTVTIMYGYY